jgi:hypothetical protein
LDILTSRGFAGTMKKSSWSISKGSILVDGSVIKKKNYLIKNLETITFNAPDFFDKFIYVSILRRLKRRRRKSWLIHMGNTMALIYIQPRFYFKRRLKIYQQKIYWRFRWQKKTWTRQRAMNKKRYINLLMFGKNLKKFG